MKRGGNLKRTPLERGDKRLTRRPVSLLLPAGTGIVPVKNAAAGRFVTAPRRAESFPLDVAALIDARDPWCIHCGSPRDLQRHHRRIKGNGGDPRPHTDCACNGVRICLACHDRAHNTDRGRREAEAEGLIIPRATLEPWTLSVLVHLADGGVQKYPSCSGEWLDYVPERGTA